MRIAAIIPARGGSKRLANKNIFPLANKPLIAYSIEACKGSTLISETFVSSDDQQILDVASAFGAIPLLRDPKYADDNTPKIHAIREAVKSPEYIKRGPFDILVIPQANSPELTPAMLDAGIQFLLQHNLWEVMSADKNGIQNAAFRIILTSQLENDFLSAHCGFVIAECKDVHTLEDIQVLEQKFKNR